MVGHNQGTDTQVHFSVAALEYTVYSIQIWPWELQCSFVQLHELPAATGGTYRPAH